MLGARFFEKKMIACCVMKFITKHTNAERTLNVNRRTMVHFNEKPLWKRVRVQSKLHIQHFIVSVESIFGESIIFIIICVVG